jgi:hypothetical protein
MKSQNIDNLLSQAKVANLYSLSKINPWVAKLTRGHDVNITKRTFDQTLNEYDNQKWRALLEYVSENLDTLTIDMLDQEFLGHETVVFSHHNKLYTGSALLARKISNQVVFDYLDCIPYLDILVEIGAGYGSVLLGYQKHGVNSKIVKQFIGTDFSPASVNIIRKLGNPTKTTSMHYDFTSISPPNFPPGSIIISHMALMMLSELSAVTIDGILSTQPRLVVNFETIREDFQDDELGYLQANYLKANDYNRNLFALLNQYEQLGKIRIVEHIPNIYAENALLPTSVIAWEPT